MKTQHRVAAALQLTQEQLPVAELPRIRDIIIDAYLQGLADEDFAATANTLPPAWTVLLRSAVRSWLCPLTGSTGQAAQNWTA